MTARLTLFLRSTARLYFGGKHISSNTVLVQTRIPIRFWMR